ncbi:hypothetical protein SteCoe_31225 [Stentor coeruleus]|uniref:FHA domain-containing protein n=1 Tax=Stentor coeruleus TaxID=5963 RepID=A0A1R2B1V6_9CILI|nr:hypothetical protein SteCoe_31225 [Stentor coeruleus]
MFKFRKLCCCFISSDGQNQDTSQDSHPIELKDQKMSSSYNKNINITTEEIIKLTLTILDTVHMIIGTQYEILPQGLINTKRLVKDGCVYAGSTEKQGRLVINDIILSEKEKGVGKRHFLIQYNKEKACFFIKDMGEGLGTFIRIEKPIKLVSAYIFSFGDSHMVVHIENTLLTLKFIEGPKVDFKNTYTPDMSPIRIGRMNECTIKFDDSSLSRCHCMIYYEDGWMMQDGDGMKPSTNGNWLFVENFFEVFDGMKFKVGETLFKAEICSDLNAVSE